MTGFDRLIIRAGVLAVTFFFFLCGICSADHHVIAVVGARIKPHSEALRGFKSVCQNCEIEEVVASDMGSEEIVQLIRQQKTKLILAIGVDALAAVKSIRNIPIVYAMVLNPSSVISLGDNATGVSINLSPEKQVATLNEVLKGRKNVMVLFNPEKTGAFVRRAQQAAQPLGIRLITREVSDAREVPPILNRGKNEADALWMIPDTTVVTPETVESIFLYSATNKVPVVSFADKYVEMGALFSMGIDPFDIGRQSGEIALRIIGGADVRTLPRVEARKVTLSINARVARKLGINIDEDILNRSRLIN